MSMLITIIVPVFAVIVLGRLAVLRRWIDAAAVRGMSDLVFYVASDETIDVWRILHHRRDIPSAMTEGGPPGDSET